MEVLTKSRISLKHPARNISGEDWVKARRKWTLKTAKDGAVLLMAAEKRVKWEEEKSSLGGKSETLVSKSEEGGMSPKVDPIKVEVDVLKPSVGACPPLSPPPPPRVLCSPFLSVSAAKLVPYLGPPCLSQQHLDQESLQSQRKSSDSALKSVDTSLVVCSK